MHDVSPPPSTIVLVGADLNFLNAVAGSAGAANAAPVVVIPEGVEQAGKRAELDTAAVIVVDLDARRRESLIALQGITMRAFGRAPVIVLADAFDDALVRWLLQIRVSDFLRKPVEPKEVLKACIRALKATASLPDDGSRILSFLSPAGGVGTTTLAIEAAMLLRKAGPKDADSTCLVDLDFQNGTCADYLDLEPRLDLDEIGPHPERLDLQLLEVMFSRHGSGLCLLAPKGRPAAPPALDAAVVTRLLDLVSSRFENVIIDLPRSWEPWTDQVLLGSNRVYVVTDMTVPGLRLGRRMAAALSGRLPDVRPRVIVNRFEQQLLFGTGLRRADVERALEGFLEGTVSNNYKLVREAIDRGLTLDDVKPGSNVSADLKRIVLSTGAGDKALVA
jgi:pilus assembly protein CpaE